jgi:hypothetical protein
MPRCRNESAGLTVRRDEGDVEHSVQYVETRGARFALHCFGSGTPVIVLHGGFRDGRVWIEIAEVGQSAM